jgi:hypothetical protein
MEAGNGATLTFACFPFDSCDGSALDGLLVPMLILSTLAFHAADVAMLFDAVAFNATYAFGGALALGGAPTFGTYFVGVEVVFVEVVPVLSGTVGAFTTVAFPSDIFTCFPADPAPASFFLFFTTSMLASEPSFKWGL